MFPISLTLLHCGAFRKLGVMLQGFLQPVKRAKK